jgi:hypothetical protein|mmetsp:Transcript_88604/g.147193  ORF Transcript_88604/g.147193 Transcript_88604/m.147193 type:complete len:93 (-) Transcript_88604:104-382(-)
MLFSTSCLFAFVVTEWSLECLFSVVGVVPPFYEWVSVFNVRFAFKMLLTFMDWLVLGFLAAIMMGHIAHGVARISFCKVFRSTWVHTALIAV